MTTSNNQLGIQALVDTSVAVLNTARTLGNTLSDGFQITDAAALFSIAGDVKLVVAEGKQAFRELLDLKPDESEEAARLIAQGASLPNVGIFGKVNDALSLLARTHREVADDIELFQDWATFVKTL